MKRRCLYLLLISCVLNGFLTGCCKEIEKIPEDVSQSTSATVLVETQAPTESPVRWYALGDSITQGYYSYFDESGKAKLRLDASQCWTQLVADKNGWELTNYGVGGSGYVKPGTVKDKLNARDHVDTLDFSAADLVTLSYGVNDWKYKMPLGSMEDNVSEGGTFYSNMRYCIEKILRDNPLVKLVVISPINCSKYGVQDHNWGIEYEYERDGSLEDYFNAEKEICEYYGIELIDMLHESVVNRVNAPIALPDGVHPSLETHKQMAAELAKKINYV